MLKYILLATGLFTLSLTAADHKIHTWTKHHLTPHFWSEGGHFGDFNKDGQGDVVVGPYWYAGPDFKKRHTIYDDSPAFEMMKDGKKIKVAGYKGELSGGNGYSNNFLTYTYDFNSDGWKDVLCLAGRARTPPGTRIPRTKKASGKVTIFSP